MQILRAKKTKLNMDMAPLIDVVFQLLIFFMLTSAFTNPAIKLNLPKSVASNSPLPEKIIVSIDQENRLYLNEALISLETLPQELSILMQRLNNKAIHIKGDGNIPYKNFVEVVGLIKQSGAEQINIVHQKESLR
jgi:biopolymer transport protein ExbD